VLDSNWSQQPLQGSWTSDVSFFQPTQEIRMEKTMDNRRPIHDRKPRIITAAI